MLPLPRQSFLYETQLGYRLKDTVKLLKQEPDGTTFARPAKVYPTALEGERHWREKSRSKRRCSSLQTPVVQRISDTPSTRDLVTSRTAGERDIDRRRRTIDVFHDGKLKQKKYSSRPDPERKDSDVDCEDKPDWMKGRCHRRKKGQLTSIATR